MDNQATREAEKIVIAAILQNRLTPEETHFDGFEFSSLDHSNIFLAAKQLRQNSNEVDLISISNYLATMSDGALTPPNPQMLMNLARSVEIPANLKPCLDLLTANRARVKIKNLAESLTSLSTDYSETPLQILEKAQNQLDAIRSTLGHKTANRQHISEIAPLMEKLYSDLREGISFNTPTGIDAIDNVTGGGAPGDVWVIGAFTGQGKSALAMQMAKNQSDRGIAALIISREMGDPENFKRLHSNVAEVPLWMVKPRMSAETFGALRESLQTVSSHKIYLDSISSDINTVCRELESFAESGGKVAYVDYLQLLEGIAGKMLSRTEELAYCSKMLKKTAMKTGLWVVELAQYNRLANYAGQAENHSFDGSSQIEKDASVVLHLELEKIDLKPGESLPKWRKATVRMSKSRNSAHTSTEIWFKGETFRFQDENPYIGGGYAAH